MLNGLLLGVCLLALFAAIWRPVDLRAPLVPGTNAPVMTRDQRFVAGVLAVVLALASLVVPWTALAQDASAPTTRIDFGPLLNEYVWPTIGSALAALAMWLFKLLRAWLQAKTGVELQKYDATVREYLDAALDRAIVYGKSKAEGYTSVDVKNVTIAHAANYALAHVPDALKRFGIDGAALDRLLEARLGATPATTGDA